MYIRPIPSTDLIMNIMDLELSMLYGLSMVLISMDLRRLRSRFLMYTVHLKNSYYHPLMPSAKPIFTDHSLNDTSDIFNSFFK